MEIDEKEGLTSYEISITETELILKVQATPFDPDPCGVGL